MNETASKIILISVLKSFDIALITKKYPKNLNQLTITTAIT